MPYTSNNNTLPEAISSEYVLERFGISMAMWRGIERDVRRGSKLFWAARGLPEPEGDWHAWFGAIGKRRDTAASEAPPSDDTSTPPPTDLCEP